MDKNDDRDAKVADLKKQLADAERSLRDLGSEVGDNLMEKAQDSMQQMGKKVGNQVDDTREKMEDATKSLHRYVKENPWPSVISASLTAGIIGFMAGYIATRDKNDR